MTKNLIKHNRKYIWMKPLSSFSMLRMCQKWGAITAGWSTSLVEGFTNWLLWPTPSVFVWSLGYLSSCLILLQVPSLLLQCIERLHCPTWSISDVLLCRIPNTFVALRMKIVAGMFYQFLVIVKELFVYKLYQYLTKI